MTTLFSEYSINSLKLKNRVVMPPMTRDDADENGFPSKRLVDYYIKRAKFGVGLIIIEGASVDNGCSRSYSNGLIFCTKEHAEFWRPIITEIKEFGASVLIQLYHAGRLTTPKLCGENPIAPSALAPMKQRSTLMNIINGKAYHYSAKDEFVVPKEMTLEQIHFVQNQFKTSTMLAVEAGFDGVELHGAHGYLLHQFSTHFANNRNDLYGENQYLFLKETAQKCKESISDKMILSLRISQHMIDSNFIRYNTSVIDFGQLVKHTQSSVDVYNCSEIMAGSPLFGYTKSLSEEVRTHTDRPIITTGQINKLQFANDLLNSNSTDLIGFGRLLIANPNLVELFQDGKGDDIIPFENEKHYNSIV